MLAEGVQISVCMVLTRPGGLRDIRLSRIIIDYHKNEAFSLVKMYSTICVELAGDHFSLRLTQIDPLLTKMRENDFYIFFPSDLDL